MGGLMTSDILINEYFEWLCKMVCGDNDNLRKAYSKLLRYLHERDFEYTIEMDSNREADGMDLRYRFGRIHGYEDPLIASYLDNRPCSILEMMVALADRCEVHIMDDPDVGDRTGKWFWDMIFNLGLINMGDKYYNQIKVSKIIDTFLNREYERDGKGGLFVIHNSKCDLRTVEIWCQMCWYLNEL